MKRMGLIGIAALLLAACQTVTPAEVATKTQVVAPRDAIGVPVVVFYQGTGGGNKRALVWADWFKERGIASVIVDNAGLRGRTNFSGAGGLDYSGDAFSALAAVSGDPRLDVKRYALMGFSRGGTQALQAGLHLDKGAVAPALVFAFYPGDVNDCQSSYETATQVRIFYGDQDQWGDYQGIRDTCLRKARNTPNVTVTILKGAHHGFDDDKESLWSAAGQSFKSAPNPEALAKTRAIIDGLLKSTWKTGL